MSNGRDRLSRTDEATTSATLELLVQQFRDLFVTAEKTLLEECYATPQVRNAQTELFSACDSVIRAIKADFVPLEARRSPPLMN